MYFNQERAYQCMAVVFGITSTIVLTFVILAFFAGLMFVVLKDFFRFNETSAEVFSFCAFCVLVVQAVFFFMCYYGPDDQCVNTLL